MRDYLYIPLGGNRHGEWATYRNMMLTMLIGGLWHGANWTFVVWGAYHGLLLVVYRSSARVWDRLPATIGQVLTFLLAVVGWVFFRSTDFSMATHLLTKMFVPTEGQLIPEVTLFAVQLGFAALWGTAGPNAFDLFREFQWRRRYAFPLAAAFGAGLAIIAGGRSSPFLYFQF